MSDNFRKFLMIEYASKVAKSESMDFTMGYYKNKIKDLSWYDNNKDLMKKHHRFLNWSPLSRPQNLPLPLSID